MKFRILMGYFILLFASIGGTFLYIKDIYSYHRIKTWPTVTGEITSINVKERQYQSKGRLKTDYHPKVEYRYKINGKRLTGNNANCFDNGNGTKEYVDEYISPYKEGMTIDVFYNKNYPAESCLNRDFNSRTRKMVIFPIIAVSLTILGLLKDKLKHCANPKMNADD